MLAVRGRRSSMEKELDDGALILSTAPPRRIAPRRRAAGGCEARVSGTVLPGCRAPPSVATRPEALERLADFSDADSVTSSPRALQCWLPVTTVRYLATAASRAGLAPRSAAGRWPRLPPGPR